MKRFPVARAGMHLPTPVTALAGLFALSLAASLAVPAPLLAQDAGSRWHRADSPDSKVQSDVQYVSPHNLGTEILALRFTKPFRNGQLSFRLFDPGFSNINEIRAHLLALDPAPPDHLLLQSGCDDGFGFLNDFSSRSLDEFSFCDLGLLEDHASLQISLLLDPRELAQAGLGLDEVHSLALIDADGTRVDLARLRDMDLWLSQGGVTDTAFGEMNLAASGVFRYAEEIRSCGRILTKRQQEDLATIHLLQEKAGGVTGTSDIGAALTGGALVLTGSDGEKLARLERELGVTGSFCASCYTDFAALAGGESGQLCSGLAAGPTLIALNAEIPWSRFMIAYYELQGERAALTDWKLELTVLKSDGQPYRYSWTGAGMTAALFTGRDG